MKRLDLRKASLTCVLAGLTLGLPLVAQADYASTVAGLNPVAYYRLSTTNPIPTELAATNLGSLGTVLNGQYQSMSLTRGVTGAIVGDPDKSVGIDGSQGQQVVVPYSAAYNPSGPFSVEFWAKPAVGSTASGNHTAAISMINGENPVNANDRSGWCVRYSGSDWQFVIGFDHSDGATFYSTTLAASGTAAEDVWQHVVAVYTPSLVSIYVNGALAASQAPANPVLPNFAAPLILGDRGYTGWDFIGDLDEFALYTSELSAAEIKQHYDNGVNAARVTSYSDLVLQKSPALYFRLGEPSLQLPVAINTGSYGQTYNGTYQVGTTPGIPGPQSPAVTGFETTNRAVGINGTNGTVSIPGLPLNSDAVTMVCWLKRDGVQPARAGLMHQRKVSAPEVKATGLQFQDDGLGLSYNWEDNGTAYQYNPGFVPPDQAWTFYAVTVAPDAQVMYMGTAAGLVASTNTYGISPHDFSGTTIEIGWDNYAATRIFRGAIDECAIFDKTLSYDQVSSLFNASLPAILSITRTPADPVYAGMTVTLQTAAAGPVPITYQWRKNGANLPGKTSATLVLNQVITTDSGDYDVQVTTGGKTLTSPVNHVTVVAGPPFLTQTPTSVVRFVNGQVSFVSGAVGSQPMSFQWKHDGVAIPGATAPTLPLTDLLAADAGEYTVVVENPLGTNTASATLTVMTPSKYSSAVLDAAPIGYWRLDETAGTSANDYWGGADGTTSVGVTNNMPGPRPAGFAGFESTNTAYSFGGNAAQVTVPPLNINKATVTIVAWINPHGDQVDYAGIVFSRGATATGLDFKGTTGQVGYHWNDAAETYSWDSGLMPTPDQWNFVALVIEPTQATMYLDNGSGLQSAVNTVNHSPATFADPLRFGVDSPNGGRGYVGLIDEVAVYDRSLSANEITALRSAGVAGTYTPTPVSIVQQPRSETMVAGTRYTLTATAKGSVPLTYQWQKNGEDLPGAIRSSLSFPSTLETDTGIYKLVVSQGATKVTSAPATLTVKPPPAYLNLTENLVLHLKFDGDYSDSSGRTHNGTAGGTPTFVPGAIGSGAVALSTVSSSSTFNYVTVGALPDFAFAETDSFSVSFWMKFTGWNNDLPMIGNAVGSTYQLGWVFANEGGKIEFSLVSTANSGTYVADPVAGSPTINDNVWHNIVGIVDRAYQTATVYVDGELAGSFTIAGLGTLDQGTALTIGQNPDGTYGVDGSASFDDVGIWRRTLSVYEAQGIYIVGSQYGRSFDTVAPPEVKLSIQLSGTSLTLQWSSGTLESSDNANSGYTTVAGASAPSYTTTISTTGSKFYRVKVQ
jgi:hypothetical protein